MASFKEQVMNIIEFLQKETSGLVPNPDRGYNGMSSIGENCVRKLQYNMYMASGEEQISRRIKRLFNEGHLFEDKLAALFEDIDLPIIGRQNNYTDENEMWFGHNDGEVLYDGRYYLLEMKTHNDKNFKDVKKQGVKKGKPTHYGQMMMYMGYGKYDYGVYIAYNKNDSDLDFQLIKFDQADFNKAVRRSVDVIASDVLFPRIGNNTASWFECKMCNHRAVCFGNEAPAKNCRTCHWVEPSNGNKWACTYGRTEIGDVPLSLEEQKAGCDNHMYGKMFNETA